MEKRNTLILACDSIAGAVSVWVSVFAFNFCDCKPKDDGTKSAKLLQQKLMRSVSEAPPYFAPCFAPGECYGVNHDG
jgi:hypothetical protein